MKKNIVIVLIIVSLTLNIVSWAFYFNKNNSEKKEKTLENNEINKDSNSWKYIISKISDEIKNDTTFNTCMTNNTNVCLNQFINEKAINNWDYKICESLTDLSLVSSCKEIVILNLSAINNDVNICNELWDKKAYCVSQILTKKAMETLDEKICDNIEDEKSASTWAIEFWNYEKTCKDTVFMHLASSKNSRAYCYKIDDKNMQDICKTNIQMLNNK